MKKQAAIVFSILFAVGTVGAAYAAEPTESTGSSATKKDDGMNDNRSLSAPCKDNKTADGKPCAAAPKVTEGSNAVPEGGVPPQKVSGKLVKIDGKNYVVTDDKGKEVTFMIDERTKMDGEKAKVGDMVRAQITPQGYAFSVNLATDAETVSPDPLAKKSNK
jgi:hypothetical protein